MKKKRYVRRAIEHLKNIELKKIVWIPLLCVIAGSMFTFAIAVTVAQAGGGLNELIVEANGGDADHTPEKAKEAAEKGVRFFSINTTDEAAALVRAHKNGEITGADIYSDNYENMLASTGDKTDLEDLYTAMSNILVVEETNVQATLGYTYIYFSLSDGTELKFTFEDEKYVRIGDKIYRCYEDGTLWEVVNRILEENI